MKKVSLIHRVRMIALKVNSPRRDNPRLGRNETNSLLNPQRSLRGQSLSSETYL